MVVMLVASRAFQMLFVNVEIDDHKHSTYTTPFL